MVSFDKTSRACLPLEFVRERMGGKGEKNYLAAHGGPARLPPPRDRSEQDALPSKLRVLMNYTSPSPHGNITSPLCVREFLYMTASSSTSSSFRFY